LAGGSLAGPLAGVRRACVGLAIVIHCKIVFNRERLPPVYLPSGCFDDIQATHKLRDPSWTPG